VYWDFFRDSKGKK